MGTLLLPWGTLVALALGVSGCGAIAQPFPYSLNGPEFLLFYGLLTGLSLLVVLSLKGSMGQAKTRLGGGLLMGGVWLLGLTRLMQGLAAGRPVLFLLFSLFFVTAALFIVLFTDQWVGSGSSRLRERDRSGGSGSCGSGGGGCGSGGGGCGGGCGGCGG